MKVQINSLGVEVKGSKLSPGDTVKSHIYYAPKSDTGVHYGIVSRDKNIIHFDDGYIECINPERTYLKLDGKVVINE